MAGRMPAMQLEDCFPSLHSGPATKERSPNDRSCVEDCHTNCLCEERSDEAIFNNPDRQYMQVNAMMDVRVSVNVEDCHTRQRAPGSQ